MASDQYPTFDDFVIGNATRLLRTAVFLVGDRSLAEDLVQITFERTARHWRRVCRLDSPDAYARRILVNLAIDERRRRLRRPLVFGGTTVDLEQISARPPAGEVDRLELQDLFARSLAALPPQQRAVIVLRYWCDLTQEQIAAELGVSTGTVKSQTSRALRRLHHDQALREEAR